MTLFACQDAAVAAVALQASNRTRETRAPALKSLDPDIVSSAIPVVFVGRNADGLWVARAEDGRAGGLFLFKSSAVDFAERCSAPRRCALVFPAETFELDIENDGNPLIAVAVRGIDTIKRIMARQRRG